jgi:hypothetical protein
MKVTAGCREIVVTIAIASILLVIILLSLRLTLPILKINYLKNGRMP